MRTKATEWFNTNTNTPLYGIKVLCDGKWMNVCEGTEPLLFEKESDRDVKRKELSKVKV